MSFTNAYVGIGANLGDRAGTIARAIAAVKNTPGLEIIAVSALWENAAVGGPADSPPFLNGAIELRTTLGARELLARLLSIELDLGRVRAERWGPRVIDLDLLLYGDVVLRAPGIDLPHPRLHERLFVLKPLADIAPGVIHPVLGQTIAALLDDLEIKSTSNVNIDP